MMIERKISGVSVVTVLICYLIGYVMGKIECPLGYDYGGAAGWDNDTDPLLYHPRFHVMPPTRKPPQPTGMNDMNAMFYYKGFYHIMYQDHIHCPDDINQANQSFGHVVTKDLIHYKHVEPALTDNFVFDNSLGPWDGPGFLCHDKPMIIYNSHTNGTAFSKQTKTAAFPSNSSDLLLDKEWVRNPLKPTSAFIGPSTLAPPWKSSRGTYLTFAKLNTGDCQLWESSDPLCLDWKVLNNFGLCPQNSPVLFSIPTLCAGCDDSNATIFTHVMTYCNGEVDAYVFGNYSEFNGSQYKPNFVSLSSPQLFEVSKRSQFEDGRGGWSEVLEDSIHGRALTMGWVPPGVSPGYRAPFKGFPPLWHMGTLMRRIEYDQRLQQLNFFPIVEYENLRSSKPIVNVSRIRLSPGETHELCSGRQLDITVIVNVPNSDFAGKFGISVLRSADGKEKTDILFEYSSSEYMIGIDLPGNDYKYFGVNYTDPHLCQKTCIAEDRCKGWTYVMKNLSDEFPVPRCCLKDPLSKAVPSSSCVSGIVRGGIKKSYQFSINGSKSGIIPSHTNRYPIASTKLPLLPKETTLELRIMIDRSIIEAFAQRGRRMITATAYPRAASTGVALFVDKNANDPIDIISATAWSMGCGWVKEL